MQDNLTNCQQSEFWNSPAGEKWVTFENETDALLAPILDHVLATADVRRGASVLDIGCGTGASVLALLDAVGPDGRVHGCDISKVMLDRAVVRVDAAGLRNATLTLADAQTYDFERQGFDHVVSRFGMMFFDDPRSAFQNISKGVRSGGRLTFVAWMALSENPWFSSPHNAAIARLGAPAISFDPDAPGPMAFHNGDRVVGLMDDAGLIDARCHPVDVLVSPMGDLETVSRMATNLGPASRLAREKTATEADMAAIAKQVAADFSKYVEGQSLRIPTRLNMFSATVG